MPENELIRNAFTPTATRPLLGLSVLVVEDSRYSCESFRLLCLKSGARIRRADCLASARRHLRSYAPNFIIVDLGLPDGSGAELIRELAADGVRDATIIGTSGDPEMRSVSVDAGAHGFLEKPIKSLSHFQSTLLTLRGLKSRHPLFLAPQQDEVSPDNIALRDDLSHADDILRRRPSGAALRYAAQFLGSVAVISGDTLLARESDRLASSDGPISSHAVAHMQKLLRERMADITAV